MENICLDIQLSALGKFTDPRTGDLVIVVVDKPQIPEKISQSLLNKRKQRALIQKAYRLRQKNLLTKV